MTPLYFHQVDPDDTKAWEHVRKLRNECASFMTGFQGEITFLAQLAFRYSFNPETQQMWLAYESFERDPIGFIYLRQTEELPWVVTYGLTERWRDQGYGKKLVQFSQLLSDGELYLEVLQSNARAHKLYMNCGFNEMNRNEKAVEMYWRCCHHDPSF